ncbi:inositol polyphosphate multikinase-like protein [Elsinoe australis]|uniref:Kinase n=1 Tax=Elsinoe australis TaxID=40998 RepID=A0A4U7B7V9_9PEZI|nr:inositol polyphosphate multikinase-like protein [Elsinoe australis]
MSSQQFERSKLTAFGDAAAGHEGVLTDESGGVVVKPCTPAELAFYEETNAHHPDFAALIPTYMGTLQLGKTEQLEQTIQAVQSSGSGPPIVLPPATEITSAQRNVDLTPATVTLKGKAIDTETAIVLQNVAAGFVKPNILDVKLGKRLWDDNAPEAKRQKLDKVADETTSGSMGFRVAGMKVWKGQDYQTYDKFYGRELKPENVKKAFQEFFDHTGDNPDNESFADVFPGALEAVEEIERVVSHQESRMYSASLLFVYEGDRAARRKAIESFQKAQGLQKSDGSPTDSALAGGDVQEDDEEDEQELKLFDVRMIDFAHATWIPGAGPDENMLRGIRSVLQVMQTIA